MQLSAACRVFLDHKLLFRRVAPASVDTYRAHLRRFQKAVGPRSPLERAARLARPFIMELSRRGRSDHYVRKAFLVLRDLMSWANAEGQLRKNPLHDQAPPMLHDKQRRFLTPREVDRLLTATRRSGRVCALRDWALLATLYYSMLRVTEACQSRPEDYDLTSCNVRVLGKGGKLRLVPFHPDLRPILRAWLRERPEGPMMFPSQSRGHASARPGVLGRTRVEFVLREVYAPAAGLGRGVTPHRLRASAANNLYKGGTGADLAAIKGLLRHASLDTTLGYLNVETPAQLRGAWKKL